MTDRSPFVVNQLVPERQGGEGIYQLNDSSVSPTRLVAITDDGYEVEETIPALAKSLKFVDGGGNICDVPLRTGRVLSNEPEAVRYEQVVIYDIIRGGQLPLDVCPYTFAFAHIKGGPLIKAPVTKDTKDCGGRVGGCEHMKAVVDDRRKRSKAKWLADQAKVETMNKDQVSAMVEAMGKIFGDAVANAQSTAGDSRAALKAGKGEKD